MKPQLVALDFVTRALGDHRQTDALRNEILAGQIPWEVVVSLANNHLLTPALWVALKDKGLVSDLPEDLRGYLQELHGLNRKRNRHLRIQLLEVVRQLNAAGIVPVLLKGAKHLVVATYSDPGIRVMSDVDLLVRQEEIPRSLAALQQLGYKSIDDIHGDYHNEHHHCAPLFRPGDYGTLEIHRSLMDSPYSAILPTEIVLADTEPLEVEGARMSILSPTHRILHNIVHSQLVDHHHDYGAMPLRSLHEVVCEQAAGDKGSADWRAIDRQMQRHGGARVLRAYLYMAHELFNMPFPAETATSLIGRLHYLRCRAQLSWEWAQRWGVRLGRYSPDTLNERYGCGSGWMAVNGARIRQLMNRVLVLMR